MNYSNILSIAMLGMFFAIVPVEGSERRSQPMTFTERREKRAMPLTTQQTEQGGIKAAQTNQFTSDDANKFRAAQNQKAKENELDSEETESNKQKKSYWNCCK